MDSNTLLLILQGLSVLPTLTVSVTSLIESIQTLLATDPSSAEGMQAIIDNATMNDDAAHNAIAAWLAAHPAPGVE